MGQQDSVFMRTFMMVLSILVILAFTFYGIAQFVSVSDNKTVATAASNANIARVSVVATNKNPLKHVAAKVVRGDSPEKLGAVCLGCHNAGVGGAPKIGDKAEWTKRHAKGLDKMVATVVHGKGIMQPRGGTKLTDDQIKTVVKYFLSKAGIK